MVSGYIVKSLV